MRDCKYEVDTRALDWLILGKKMSKRALAKACGISETTIYAAFHTKKFNYELMTKLIDILQIPPSERGNIFFARKVN